MVQETKTKKKGKETMRLKLNGIIAVFVIAFSSATVNATPLEPNCKICCFPEV